MDATTIIAIIESAIKAGVAITALLILGLVVVGCWKLLSRFLTLNEMMQATLDILTKDRDVHDLHRDSLLSAQVDEQKRTSAILEQIRDGYTSSTRDTVDGLGAVGQRVVERIDELKMVIPSFLDDAITPRHTEVTNRLQVMQDAFATVSKAVFDFCDRTSADNENLRDEMDKMREENIKLKISQNILDGHSQ